MGRFLYEFGWRQREAMRNTFFVFTSDHGDMLGDHCLWRKGYSYDGSSRIPFFIKYPDTWDMPRGQACDEIIEMRGPNADGSRCRRSGHPGLRRWEERDLSGERGID